MVLVTICVREVGLTTVLVVRDGIVATRILISEPVAVAKTVEVLYTVTYIVDAGTVWMLVPAVTVDRMVCVVVCVIGRMTVATAVVVIRWIDETTRVKMDVRRWVVGLVSLEVRNTRWVFVTSTVDVDNSVKR